MSTPLTASRSHHTRPLTPTPRPRFLAEADCHDIAHRLARFAKGGGETDVHIVSRWTGNVRWARNRVSTTGEDRDTQIQVWRRLRGAVNNCFLTINDVSDGALVAAARRAERLAQMNYEKVDADVESHPQSPVYHHDEPVAIPQLFFESTYQLDAGRRAETARQLMHAATAAGMLSAGYIQVSATSFAYITSWGYTQYYQYTWAQYSTTVRDPTGVGSGWAGVDWPDWSKINGEHLSAIALDKCLKSRNPVAVEPGRYTTILEPQAVCDFVGQWGGASDRYNNESNNEAPFYKSAGFSRLGEKVIDERLTFSADPTDPELGFPPYSKSKYGVGDGDVYHPVTWIDQGVLTNLAYDHEYAVDLLGCPTGLPNSGAFRMRVSGETTSPEEMIATTKRGLLVTRFDQVEGLDGKSMLYQGYTRDGLWLIENGRISKAIKNMLFVESILFALNNVEQVGVPQRAFHPEAGGIAAWYTIPQPVIVPPLKIRDFSFTALAAAI